MNIKTMALAIGVAGVLMVAGLATLLSNSSLSDLLGQQDSTGRSGSDDQATDTIGPDVKNDTSVVTDPVTVDPGPVDPAPVPEPDPVQGEPRLNVAYTAGPYGNLAFYGMPLARSGPYPWNDHQTPGANEFRIETNGYGPEQPDGPVKISLLIQVDGIGSRWVGSTEIPEGTVEVRTFPENAITPRLVNLFNDGQGNCKGILVNDWSVFDHTFVYEQGVTDNHQLTFSLDITKLGDHTVKVWAVHDHGDGTAAQVSNMVSWSVHVAGSGICYNSMNYSREPYAIDEPVSIGLSVTRSTEPDDDNVNVKNTVAYTGTVRNVLRVEGTGGYSVAINGVVQTGVMGNGWKDFDLGSVDFGRSQGHEYSVIITFSDGISHLVEFTSYDAGNGESLGHTEARIWPPSG